MFSFELDHILIPEPPRPCLAGSGWLLVRVRELGSSNLLGAIRFVTLYKSICTMHCTIFYKHIIFKCNVKIPNLYDIPFFFCLKNMGLSEGLNLEPYVTVDIGS